MHPMLKRQREIAEILTRNGFGFLVSVSGLARRWPGKAVIAALSPSGTTTKPGDTDALHSPVIVRRTLEELGPTFIKLGQVLSTRADLIPADIQAELAQLRTNVPAEPFRQIKGTVESELGAPLDDLFAEFSRTPLGSASIGQTHLARLKDGREVVVKVQRAAAAETLRIDISIMRTVATALQRRWGLARELDVVSFVDEFDRQITGELNYTLEGKNAERIAKNFKDRPGLRVPTIFWEATGSRVLTMERLVGIPIDDVEALTAAGIDPKALGKRAATFILDMVLVDGFFHGDPHPGNLLVGADGSILLLDYGMVGSLSDAHRRQMVVLVTSFATRDSERMSEALIELAPPSARVDRAALNREVANLINQYADRPLSQIPMVDVVNELVVVLGKHKLKPPSELSMVAKMLTMVDGIGRTLDPNFNLMGVLKPYGAKLLRQRLEPDALLRTLLSVVSEASALGVELPEQVRRLLRHYEQEGLNLSVDERSLVPVLARLDALGDRLVAGMLLAALISAVGALGATDNRWLSRARGPLLMVGFSATAVLAGFLGESVRRR